MFAQIIQAIISISKIGEQLERLVSALDRKFDEAVEKATAAKFEKYKAEMNETLARIENADNKEERRKLAKELSNRINR